MNKFKETEIDDPDMSEESIDVDSSHNQVPAASPNRICQENGRRIIDAAN